MNEAKSELLRGTLDMLILKKVALGPRHGYAIAQGLRQVSKDFFTAISSAPSSRRSRLAPGAVARHRHRPRSQVLRDNQKRPQAARNRSPWLGAALQRSRFNPESRRVGAHNHELAPSPLPQIPQRAPLPPGAANRRQHLRRPERRRSAAAPNKNSAA